MFRLRSIIILLLVAILSSAITYILVGQGEALNLTKSEQLISQATGDSVIILKNFKSYANLQGFVLQGKTPNAPLGIMYTDKAGRYLVYGQIFTDQGLDLARTDYLKYVQPQASLQAFSAAAKTAWIQQGSDSAPHKLYIVADPNCRFCNSLYSQLQDNINSGQLAVRWINVAFLKPSSNGRALAILAASNPQTALAENEKGFNDAEEEGGISQLSNPPKEAQMKLDNNMAFMRDNSIVSTPTLLYRTVNNLVQMQAGLTKDTDLNALVSSFSDKWE